MTSRTYARQVVSASCTTRFTAALILAVGLFATTACERRSSPASQPRETEDSIGVQASITAAFRTTAAEHCHNIGIVDLEKCTQVEGTLPDERAAKVAAKLAVDQGEKYWSRCLSSFPKGYCDQLLKRALEIEMRKAERIRKAG